MKRYRCIVRFCKEEAVVKPPEGFFSPQSPGGFCIEHGAEIYGGIVDTTDGRRLFNVHHFYDISPKEMPADGL